MESLIYAMIAAHREVLTTEARSALPDAPVVDTAQRRYRAGRTRTAVAGSLRRIADSVAPPRAASTAGTRAHHLALSTECETH